MHDRFVVPGDATVEHPATRTAVPFGPLHPVAELDVLADPELVGGLANVGEDRATVGDGLGLRPRLEAVPESVHVAVRTYAGVAEQVPGAARVLATFEDRPAAFGGEHLQPVGCADAGEPGSDDQDIDMLGVTHDERVEEPDPRPTRSGVGRVDRRNPVAPRHGLLEIGGEREEERVVAHVRHELHADG